MSEAPNIPPSPAMEQEYTAIIFFHQISLAEAEISLSEMSRQEMEDLLDEALVPIL